MKSEQLPEGRRETKRRETHRRITDAAMRLFARDGYEATTVDAIVAEAGIARRTLFHYFGSKDEIILAWQSALPSALHAAILRQAAAPSAFDAVKGGIMAMAADADPEFAVTISRIVRAEERLQASNRAKFVHMEEAALDALRSLDPDAREDDAMRLAALVGVGVMRLAVDAWSEAGGERPLSDYVADLFAALPHVLPTDTA